MIYPLLTEPPAVGGIKQLSFIPFEFIIIHCSINRMSLIFQKSLILDYILVYTEDNEKPADPKHLDYREKFLANLKKSHLHMEEVYY